MTTFTYAVSGNAARDQTWEIIGTIEAKPGEFHAVFERAMIETFKALTSGKAVFGKPGVGCSGPYGITRLVIEQPSLPSSAVELANEIVSTAIFR